MPSGILSHLALQLVAALSDYFVDRHVAYGTQEIAKYFYYQNRFATNYWRRLLSFNKLNLLRVLAGC